MMAVRLSVCLAVLVIICAPLTSIARRRSRNLRPGAKGPNVCAVQEVENTRQRFFSACFDYKYSQVCGHPTFVRYYCCSGFTKIEGEPGCSGVKPLEDIVYTARNMLLDEFVKMSEAADLTDQLSNEGAYTVFIPENEAFQKLTDKERKNLVPPRSSGKPSLLSYHMVQGRHSFKDFKRNQHHVTLYKDKKLMINKYSNGITTVNCARIVRPNEEATNGIVHVIDRVIKPLDEKGTLLDVINDDKQDRFSQLSTALILTGLDQMLRDEDEAYTFFAPSNKAFSRLPSDYFQRLVNEPGHHGLKALLKNHMVKRPLCADSIYSACGLRSLNGQIIKANCNGNGLTIQGKKIQERDILATNGVVHVVDDIFIPDAAKDLTMKAQDLKLNKFMNFTKDIGFLEKLKSTDEEFTLFAPTDEAFEAVPRSYLEAIRSQPTALENVVKYHIAKGKMTTDSFISQQSVKTESSISADIKVTVYRKGLAVNDATVTNPDNTCANGVIHVVDKVMLPPESDLLDMIRSDPDLSSFYSTIETAGLASLFADSDQLTVVAPTNEAFDAMDRSDLEKMLLDPDTLEKVIRNHVVDRLVASCGFLNDAVYNIRSNHGELLHFKRSNGDISVTTDTIKSPAFIFKVDEMATNGILYKVDTVLPCMCGEE
ncbi:transforming growth factor-beta-induced protein ig-h3-like [Liolophura sinensis]|uniref:transforming growth factor-beta-induced protein ig-h3-like n=1 Tax=Liolophura sinensis TaxID=3198878 RepID=UPI003158E165